MVIVDEEFPLYGLVEELYQAAIYQEMSDFYKLANKIRQEVAEMVDDAIITSAENIGQSETARLLGLSRQAIQQRVAKHAEGVQQ